MARAPRGVPRIFAVFFVLLVARCDCGGEEECPPRVITSDEACVTTLDCVDAGLKQLTCVEGLCRMPCVRDSDCILPKADQDELAQCPDSAITPAAVCESQLCVPGCPDLACGANQQCVNARCVYYAQSFEIPPGKSAVDLIAIGWNEARAERELPNAETVIAWEGPIGCNLGDDRCAGPASRGERFVAIESVQPPERGTPDVGQTCRACACCLECILDPPATIANIPNCPGNSGVPVASVCPGMHTNCAGFNGQCLGATPFVCQTVCNDCTQCLAAGQAGDRLLSCESDVAAKTCTSCPNCVAQCVESCGACAPKCGQADAHACCAIGGSECVNQCDDCIETSCPACWDCLSCGDAEQCELSEPGTQHCRRRRTACNALGNDGCYPAPTNYPRAELTELEQSLESPAINLSGASGRVVLQFDYVPFNVGEEYRRGEQGKPPSEWNVEPQEVIVQFCAADCGVAANWSDAQLAMGGTASIPPPSQRRNGLSMGNQSGVDWRNGRVEITIPDGMRTSTFKFRFVPRLDKDTRVGVDNILVRGR